MKEKDIKLFNKTIHELKELMYALKKEREVHHEIVNRLQEEHNSKIEKITYSAGQILEEINELYEHLYKDKNEDE